MSGQPNAEAGPSTQPALFLKPTAPPQPPPRLASTHDLLARFRLLQAYDKYVRPPPDEPPEAPADNGKGKARELSNPNAASPAPPHTPGGVDVDAEDEEHKGEKKRKNSYKHLIKGIPGKHSYKKDDYLAGIMQVPPKQCMAITPFDLKTQREAFSVSLEGLKGWNPSALVVESAQAREDRKKRKELKRLAKAHAAAAATGSPAPPSASSRPGTPRTGSGTGTGTPRPRPSLAPVVVPGRVGTPQRTGTPTSAVPRTATPTSAYPRTATPTTATSVSTPHPPPLGEPKRGVKREREAEGVGSTNGMQQQQNGVPVARTPPMIVAAKAGIAGARPRPIKKQRMDMQGGARDATVQQQPTPQGV